MSDPEEIGALAAVGSAEWPVEGWFRVARTALGIGVVLMILGYLVRKPNAG